MKSIVIIDPWGINNEEHYLAGLCSGLSKKNKIVLFTNYYSCIDIENIEYHKIFFKYSEKMNRTILRKILRGFEYIFTYIRIVLFLRKRTVNVVHIEWLLNYRSDIFFLKSIKKRCDKLIYTAHNILPHINSNQYIDQLSKIYFVVDTILVHGDKIRNEFQCIFPQYIAKVKIQKHGIYLGQNTKYDLSLIEKDYINVIEKFNKIYIYFGHIFYNKGVDRLINIWIDEFHNENILLIIVGKKHEDYAELNKLENCIYKTKNILYIDKYVNDNLLNFFITKSNLIILPYRHASMSGIVFTAAEFSKPILCTDTGALSEYILNNKNSFIVENSDIAIKNKLIHIFKKIDNNELKLMGINLNKYINENYSWNKICDKLTKDIYMIK